MASGITSGSIFRPINRHGQVLPAALTGTTVAAIVKAYASRSGLDPATFLRSLASSGVPDPRPRSMA